MIRNRSTSGFTLVELLVVVAIIAILAAVATVNFLEAQVRARVSRVHSDLRALSTAAESYNVDHGAYPPNNSGFLPLMLPVPYIHDVLLVDPFDKPQAYFLLNTSRADDFAEEVISAAFPDDRRLRDLIHDQQYLFTSAGPDETYVIEEIDGDPEDSVVTEDFVAWLQSVADSGGAIYDPTNGTISGGDIGRSTKGIATPTLFR